MSTRIEDIDFKAPAKECKTQEDLAGLTKQFMKHMIEGMLQAELEEHLEENSGSKNGTYPKTVRSDSGKVTLDIPRDREGEYKPQLIPKGQRDISGIDDKVIAMYAGGMSLRDIERRILEMYDVEMFDTLIGGIIDKITPQVKARPCQAKRSRSDDSL